MTTTTTTMIQTALHSLRALVPILHEDYTPVLFPRARSRDPLPRELRLKLTTLLCRRDVAADADIPAIDAEIVGYSYWYALRPDRIARDVIRYYGRPRPGQPLSIAQAELVVAALGEAGYPIAGNGAPDYADQQSPPPTRGQERDRVLWNAATHWACMAAKPLTYVSFGDCRGFLPRPVQFDEPGSMHPEQRAALTLGPWADRGDEAGSHAYIRRHTRLLLLVRVQP